MKVKTVSFLRKATNIKGIAFKKGDIVAFDEISLQALKAYYEKARLAVTHPSIRENRLFLQSSILIALPKDSVFTLDKNGLLCEKSEKVIEHCLDIDTFLPIPVQKNTDPAKNRKGEKKDE